MVSAVYKVTFVLQTHERPRRLICACFDKRKRNVHQSGTKVSLNENTQLLYCHLLENKWEIAPISNSNDSAVTNVARNLFRGCGKGRNSALTMARIEFTKSQKKENQGQKSPNTRTFWDLHKKSASSQEGTMQCLGSCMSK